MSTPPEAVISDYLAKLQNECRDKQWRILAARKPEVANEIQAEPPEIQIAFLKTVLANVEALAPGGVQAAPLAKIFFGLFAWKPAERSFSWLEFRTLGTVVSSILRQKLPFRSGDLADIVRSYAKHLKLIHHSFPLASLIGQVESGTRTAELEEAMQSLKNSLASVTRHSNSKQNRKLLERLNHYLTPEANKELVTGGPWSSKVFDEISRMSHEPPWPELFCHCLAVQSTTPSKAWRQRAEQLIAAVGVDKVKESAVRWLGRDTVPLATDPGARISDKDADYLKGFIWVLAITGDGALCKEVADLGIACLRKIPHLGPVSARVGFASISALAEMPGMEPVAQLTRMRMKVKYAVALRMIEKALTKAAARSGLSRDDLEDMAVPHYGLDAGSKRMEKFGTCDLALVLTPGSGQIDWFWKNAEGKSVKSAPAEVKQNHAPKLKELKRTATDMQKMLSAQRLRIEQFLVNERQIGYEHWREHFLHHPILSGFAKRLIWHFETNGSTAVGIWHEDKMVHWDNQPIEALGSNTVVQLWHPLQSDPQTILSWRCWLEDHQVVQPFKQAHREVYILTPREEQTETYSNRFAAHVIRQHSFASLCRERGWRYRLMGAGFDGHNVPALELIRRGMKAEFWVELANVDSATDPHHATDQLSGSGINLYLVTDQVRFYRDGAQLRLADVPGVVFSEVMRDVDLFVGVTSIGNDPTWVDRPEGAYGEYWWNFAFGELSKSGETRRVILERLLPQLKIADRCRLENKFLVVRGDLHTYKIHLGSANVLMEPGSRYLCIVPGRPVGTWYGHLYLPFDGDHTLAVILSKAMLLAADKKITDVTILRQMGHSSLGGH